MFSYFKNSGYKFFCHNGAFVRKRIEYMTFSLKFLTWIMSPSYHHSGVFFFLWHSISVRNASPPNPFLSTSLSLFLFFIWYFSYLYSILALFPFPSFHPSTLSIHFTNFTSTVLTLFPPLVSSLPLSLHLSPNSFIPHLCLHSSLPGPFATLPALRLCAALHGQRAPRLISSQSPGNTRKLPNTCSGRVGGGQEDWLIFQGKKVEKNIESHVRDFQGISFNLHVFQYATISGSPWCVSLLADCFLSLSHYVQ